MKKLIVAGVMALSFLGATAQTKIGYISFDAVMGAMPETQKASKELQEYQESLIKAGEDLEKEANERTAQFIKDSATFSASMKEIKRGEIMTLIQRVNNYSNEIQEKLKEAQQQKIAPIQDKALNAIKAAAKKNGYSYVLDNNSVFVGPPGDDILSLVKKEMGIKETPAAPAAAPATKPAAAKQ